MPLNAMSETQTLQHLKSSDKAPFEGVLVPMTTFRYWQEKIDDDVFLQNQLSTIPEQECPQPNPNDKFILAAGAVILGLLGGYVVFHK